MVTTWSPSKNESGERWTKSLKNMVHPAGVEPATTSKLMSAQMEGSKVVGYSLNNWGYAARGAVSYLGSTAANKIAGLNSNFSWANLAASSLSSVVNHNIQNPIVDAARNAGNPFLENFVGNLQGGIIGGAINGLAGNGLNRDGWGNVVVDAFGNALATEVIKLGNKPQTTSPAKQVNKSTADIFDGRQLLASNDPLPSFMGDLGSGSGGIVDASGMSYEKTMSLLRMKGSSTMVPESFADIDRAMAIEDAGGWADIDRAMAFEDSPPIDEIIITGIRPKGLGPVYGTGGYSIPNNNFANLVNTDWVRDTINRHQRPMIFPNPVITKPVANLGLSQSSKAFSSAASASSVGSLNGNSGEYKTLKGSVGSARDYGDRIVVNDLDGFVENNQSGIKIKSQGDVLQCYNVGAAVGLGTTSTIEVGAHIEEGMFLEKGTLIMFASPLDKGGVGYASSNKAYPNYAPGQSSHLAMISQDYTYNGNKLPVVHQYRNSGGLRSDTLTNHPNRPQVNAINNLENAYIVTNKKK